MDFSRSFRFICEPSLWARAEELLAAQGFALEQDMLLPPARLARNEPLPLGLSLAARFGCLYIQDRSSMLPPLALNPSKGAAVLDMCASPGSKTGLLGLLTGGTGFVLGNEPSAKRLATLRRNMQAQNMLCCASTSYFGDALPFPTAGAALPDTQMAYPGWQAILLDPPCSGWGTADSEPLWQGEKLGALTALQRRLLAEAARVLSPGARVSYSTCTTSVEENEDQVIYACQELGFELVPLAPPAGFALAAPKRPGCEGVWRIERDEHGQGFFVALLQKKLIGPSVLDDANAPGLNVSGPNTLDPDALGSREKEARHGSAGFFVRPWEKESRHVGERRRHGGARQNGAHSKKQGANGIFLDRAALAGPYLDPSLLPPGDVALFGSTAYFLPKARAGLVPSGMTWKAFALGKMGRKGEIRSFNHLRRLMPGPDALNGAPALVVEDIGPLLDLVSGQSLAVDAKGPELGLYYKDLPLCRLAVKGGRAVLPNADF